MSTITSTNSILTLSVFGLYPTPQRIQGFMADSAFTTDAQDLAEIVMGVDGRMSAGYVPNPVVMTISIMPDSPSQGFFENVIGATKSLREVFSMQGTLLLPSIGRLYTLNTGILNQGKILPDVQRVLQGTPFQITWESVTSAAAV